MINLKTVLGPLPTDGRPRLLLTPDRIMHPRFAESIPGKGKWVLCRRDALEYFQGSGACPNRKALKGGADGTLQGTTNVFTPPPCSPPSPPPESSSSSPAAFNTNLYSFPSGSRAERATTRAAGRACVLFGA